MKLLQALRNAVTRLESNLKDSDLFEHRGDKGEFRERVVEEFLRPFLPPCYGLGSGAVFSSDGNQSKQIDVVIYDSVFSNVLFRDRTNSLFPCEAVFGLIEVKSELDSAQLSLAVDNVASLKRLSRQPSDMCDLLPFRRLRIGGGLRYDGTMRNPYVSFVFGYRGLIAEAVVQDLNQRVLSMPEAERSNLPDFIFNKERGYMVMRVRDTGTQLVPVSPGAPFDRFAHVACGADILPLFFLTVNIYLNEIILKAPDLNAYWIDVVNVARASPQ
jgi:hypothetical protein